METLRKTIDSLYASLNAERSTFVSHWRDLADYILPRRVQFQLTDANKGDKRNNKIIDSTATLAARTLRAGMMAGITSPARPWKRLTVPDPSLAEYTPVKRWLHTVNQRMDTVFLRSNLYNVLPYLYGDQSTFGTGAMALLEDDLEVIRAYSIPVGSYSMALNQRGKVDVFIREVPMTVRQVCSRFLTGDPSLDESWENISLTVRNLYKRGNLDAVIQVNHCIMPNSDYYPGMMTSRYKKYKSVYYEHGSTNMAGDGEKVLSEKGYNRFRILAPRWDVAGSDVYGTACPGMDCLGDIKALQLMQKRRAEAVEKIVRPPMVGPSVLRSAKASILPGDITYLDVREGQMQFKPVYAVDPRINELLQDISSHQERIKRSYFEDLFLMMLMSDRREITAAEVAERSEEKLLMLGPTLERENDELLDPLIDITFDDMVSHGMVPDAPPELEGVPLKVEYISIMAQAQKMVGAGGLERFSAYVGGVAKADPNALDKINTDAAINDYGDMLGVNPNIIRSDEEANSIREARAKEQQRAAKLAMIDQAAGAAQKLSQADTGGDNALSRITGTFNPAAGAA